MHEYGLLSLLPPLTAIFLAILTRRILTSLLVGVLLGALIVHHGNPLNALTAACETHLWGELIDPDHLRVFAFTMTMGAMVGVLHASGGMHGVVRAVSRWATGRRSGQLATWSLGMAMFFDDYANSLLLGGLMRPLTDRLKISREKLAYLVDSTAAPVAGLALISTWVATEIGYIEKGFEGVSGLPDAVGWKMFVASIPYRFYVLWALMMVPIVAFLKRDFGPMLSAERKAWKGESGENSALESEPEENRLPEPDPQKPARWVNAVLPVAFTLAATILLLNVTGTQSILLNATETQSTDTSDEAQSTDTSDETQSTDTSDETQAADTSDASWWDRLTAGDSYLALMYGSLCGLLTAAGLSWLQGILNLQQIRRAASIGARQMIPALTVLWLAWALSGLTEKDYLNTGNYLGDVLKQALAPQWLPTLVFLLAAAVAFSTGTSWGTMALLTPLAIETAWAVLAREGVVSLDDPILLGSIGGVLAGAIFGDHCSPLSDTTVLSSRASGCDLTAHVRTQLPYALVAAALAVLLGTIPIGFGVPAIWLLPLGPLALIGIMWVFGRSAEEN